MHRSKCVCVHKLTPRNLLPVECSREGESVHVHVCVMNMRISHVNNHLVSSPDCHALRAKDGLEQLLQILGTSIKRFFHSKRTFITKILF